MSGWGYFILGTLASVVVFLVVLLILNRKKDSGLTNDEVIKLKELKDKEKANSLDIEKEFTDKVNIIHSEEKEAIININRDLEDSLEGVDNAIEKEIINLVNNPDHLADELDKLTR